MKKGNKKLLIIAALLLVVTISLSTYAIYKTSVSGTATVTAATWNVNFKNGATTLTQNFDLVFSTSECTDNAHVKDGVIAPGATCTKTITIDATDAEVDVAYTAAVSGDITATKGGSAVSTTGANAFTASLSPANGTIAYDANTKTVDITLTVTWAGASSDGDTINAADTTLNGATITVPVTLTATQVVD